MLACAADRSPAAARNADPSRRACARACLRGCLAGSGASRSWWLILSTLSDGQAELPRSNSRRWSTCGRATVTHQLDALEVGEPCEPRLESHATDPKSYRDATPAGKQKFDERLNRVNEPDARIEKHACPPTRRIRCGNRFVGSKQMSPSRAMPPGTERDDGRSGRLSSSSHASSAGLLERLRVPK